MTTASSNERLVELHGWSTGEAAAKLVELATQQGYTVAATAPGTYRLARTRRKLIGKRSESVVASVFADRSGTKARIVGPIDSVIVEHLLHGGRPAPVASPTPSAAQAPAPMSAGPPAPPPAAPPAPSAPTAPRPPSPPAAPLPPGQLISTPSWMTAPTPTPAPTPAPASGDHDDRTVARSSLRRSEPVGGSVCVTLPDGRKVDLAHPVVVGRNPDPALGPPGAVPVAITDQSVSKSHAVIAAVDGAVWVTDLHSTNGTAIESAGASAACRPGERCRVEPGATIVAGHVRIPVGGGS